MSTVQTVTEKKDESEKYLELSREQMVSAMSNGSVFKTVSVDPHALEAWRPIKLVGDLGSQFLTLTGEHAHKDDLGNLPFY